MNIEKMGSSSPEKEPQEDAENLSTPEQEDAENLSTPEQVIGLMESSKSEEEWNANCDKVKAAHKGYPDWWYKEIVMSEVAAKTQAKWEK